MTDETSATPRIAIAATFTADPLRTPLRFWMDTLDISADIVLAPYAQVMQELLNPASLLATNVQGFNVLLIRVHDWIRDRLHESDADNLLHLREVAREFAAGVRRLRSRSSAALLICFNPSPSSAPAVHDSLQIERDLVRELGVLPHTFCWTHSDLARLYPVDAHEDSRSDRIGHIPYTQEYFAALATLLARRIATSLKPQYKVIAVDCDNTLWKGVCGEDGAAGLELTPMHLALQQLLVRQHDAGVLLCLCSKNNPEDVAAVFRSRPEMPLREHHFISSRVNWREKSSNLRSLADELDLSLDSFMFIDDSAMECAEVSTHCPSVLALRWLDDPTAAAHFLDHVWAFDRLAVTEDARRRTTQYRENRERSQALQEMGDLDEFLASLELKVTVAAPEPQQLPRVAELIQRTNQFNLTGIRRRASEFEAVLGSGELRCVVAHVKDRFGDYGLVGAVLYACNRTALAVDTFVLSCRALGRGVEHRIVTELGRVAREAGLSNVTLAYRPTARNEPARAFVEQSFAQFRDPRIQEERRGAEAIFVIPVDYAEGLGNVSPTTWVAESEGPRKNANAAPISAAPKWHDAALALTRIKDVVQAIGRYAPKAESRHGERIAPRTVVEETVARIWADVLGLAHIGTEDDFVELGGDSVLAVQVIASIGDELGLELSIYDFFEGPTVAEIARKLSVATAAAPAIACEEQALSAPLSSAQLRLWVIYRLEGANPAYNVPLALRLRGDLNQPAFHDALDGVVARHDVLRTTFNETDGVPSQVVHANGRFALTPVDLRSEPEARRESQLSLQLRDEASAPFDLTAGPLIRGRLIQLAADEHILVVTMHHIISDGWSLSVFIRDLCALYECSQQARPPDLAALPVRYADYVRWQREWQTQTDVQAQRDYWVAHLRGAPALLELPADRPRPGVQSHQGASLTLSLGTALTAEIGALSRRLNLTVAMTLHAAWSILLSKLSGQDNVVVGVPVANRRRRELEGLIGFFANTLALRVSLQDDPTVEQTLEHTRHVMLSAYSHQDTPFEEIVDALQPERSLSHSPIFQVMFSFQNFPRDEIRVSGATLSTQDVPAVASQFDLVLSLWPSGDDVCGTLNYATDLFDGSTIERWIGCFKSVLRAMARQAHLRISQLPLLDETQLHQVLHDFNRTPARYEHETLIHRLFEEQAERSPEATALIYEGAAISYSRLNATANQLAHYLRLQGAGPDSLVGICVERSLDMVIALLAVLKSGSAYVPLDPSYPRERLAYMLRDAAPRVLLTQQGCADRIPRGDTEVLVLDRLWQRIAALPANNLDHRELGLRPEHLAYVIYTSGSTGQPKGAMNEHRAVVNRLQWMQQQYQLGAADTVVQKTPFSFDVSVWEFFWPLMSGARLVLARPGGHQDPEYLRGLIETTRVTVLHFVPSMLQIFLERIERGRCGSVRLVVCSGEELPARVAQDFFQRLPDAQLANLYGPTEAAVDVTFWNCDARQRRAKVPIGRPIANVQMYVLDSQRQPVPIGAAGEIYIGGVGVGRGYLNRPQLTADRFVADPYSSAPHARMYKTGDIGHWCPDGAIEYLGRNDHQLKIRGLRVELGEIESQLLQNQDVKEAVVIGREDAGGQLRLIAYLVSRDPTVRVDIEALRGDLQLVLPDYMVPGAFVSLQHMPLSPNGKLDRRALPEPEPDAFSRRDYQPPQGEVELKLATLWQSVLHLERVGRDDNFFRLGGTSLSAMQLQARMQASLAMEVPMRLLFEYPHLKDLSARIGELRHARMLEKAARSGVDVKELMDKVASMRPHEVSDLLRELSMEGGL